MITNHHLCDILCVLCLFFITPAQGMSAWSVYRRRSRHYRRSSSIIKKKTNRQQEYEIKIETQMSGRRFSERMLHKKCVITRAEKRLCGTAFQYYHICYHRIFFSLRWTRGHCLKKITVEQFILTRQIICQDQRLFVRKKKKDSETTSAICDHTRWPQRLPKDAVQKVSFRVSHLKLLVCPFVFVCVCVSARTYTVSGPRSSSWWRTRGFSRRSNVSRWNKRRGRSSLQM